MLTYYSHLQHTSAHLFTARCLLNFCFSLTPNIGLQLRKHDAKLKVDREAAAKSKQKGILTK